MYLKISISQKKSGSLSPRIFITPSPKGLEVTLEADDTAECVVVATVIGVIFTCAVEVGVVDFRRDRETRNQLVSYVKEREANRAFVFVSSLAVDRGLFGNLDGETTPSRPIAFPGP